MVPEAFALAFGIFCFMVGNWFGAWVMLERCVRKHQQALKEEQKTE